MIQNKQGLSWAKLSQPNHLITTTYSSNPATIYDLQPPTLTGYSSNTLDLHVFKFCKKSIVPITRIDLQTKLWKGAYP